MFLLFSLPHPQCESVFNKDRNQTYSCQYVPAMEGEYRIIIKFGGKEVHKSPFKVLVEGAAGDPTKVTAKGPGLEKTGVSVNTKTYFEVFTKGEFLVMYWFVTYSYSSVCCYFVV